MSGKIIIFTLRLLGVSSLGFVLGWGIAELLKR